MCLSWFLRAGPVVAETKRVRELVAGLPQRAKMARHDKQGCSPCATAAREKTAYRWPASSMASSTDSSNSSASPGSFGRRLYWSYSRFSFVLCRRGRNALAASPNMRRSTEGGKDSRTAQQILAGKCDVVQVAFFFTGQSANPGVCGELTSFQSKPARPRQSAPGDGNVRLDGVDRAPSHERWAGPNQGSQRGKADRRFG